MDRNLMKNENRAVLLISCPERLGIISAVSNLLFSYKANIVQFDQHTTDSRDGMFFMRIQFDLDALPEAYPKLEKDLSAMAEEYPMEWRLSKEKQIKRMAIFVSKMDHCLVELLWRWKSKEILVDIPMVISNHPDAKETVEAYGIPFYHIPMSSQS